MQFSLFVLFSTVLPFLLGYWLGWWVLLLTGLLALTATSAFIRSMGNTGPNSAVVGFGLMLLMISAFWSLGVSIIGVVVGS